MVTPHPTVLLTGFDAFGNEATNPSGQAVQRLQGQWVAGHRVVALELPTVFGASTDRLLGALRDHRPALVLATGVAPSRRLLALERVAVNLDDARIPDNRGRQPVDEPVVADGPTAYFATLPLKAMLHALARNGFDAELSGSAGSFVCNHLFYGLMHALRDRTDVRAGFVHLPPATVLPVDRAAQALVGMLQAALVTSEDRHVAAGSLDGAPGA